MKVTWNSVLSVEYLSEMNCWASLQDLQKVIPFHSDKYKQIILNASTPLTSIPSHDLSFCTAFIISVLFLMVKASRPMTYQFLTVQMVKSIGENGIINQTVFKTNERYGFDSLIFSIDVLTLINNYINLIRPRLNPVCDYLLVCRNGTQISKLSDVFGRIVFQAIGKYINPTRYRQIVETESAENLNSTDQSNLTEDQKHTSNVAKIHYQKLRSESIALKAKKSFDKLCDNSQPMTEIKKINVEVPVRPKGYNVETSYERNNDIDLSITEKSNYPSRKRKVPFSELEDGFIKKSLTRYGNGRWTSIINDPEYKFHPSRQPATLAVRAKKLKL